MLLVRGLRVGWGGGGDQSQGSGFLTPGASVTLAVSIDWGTYTLVFASTVAR